MTTRIRPPRPPAATNRPPQARRRGVGPSGDDDRTPQAHASDDNYFIKLHLIGDLLLIRPKSVASDHEWSSKDNSSESEEEEEVEAAEEEAAVEDGTVRNRRRKPRKPVKCPKDLIVVKEIDEGGLPIEKRARLRLRLLVGPIARQKIPLDLPGFKSLDKMEKWRLLDTWVTPLLKFSEDMKTVRFRQLMMIIAKAWRNHKSKLKTHFVKQGLTPFAKYPYIQLEDWDKFVKMIDSEEAEKESQRFKKLRARYKEVHTMGSAGYDGMEARWEEEDRKLAALGSLIPMRPSLKGVLGIF
ncbi:uncharacterized protein C2845_PM07G11210 [Panicum miliaceum]|uniref:Uncharacterized protein n=1 Tax=Panicum miliaceum TaxID=4540 RepID=A0A3L6SUL2_PANMI|nr:uncharacterized protein C2845_PM07G11210 [Panicum miliaceum]